MQWCFWQTNTKLMRKWKNHILKAIKLYGDDTKASLFGSYFLTNKFKKDFQLFDEYHIFNGLNNMFPLKPYHCIRPYLEKPYSSSIELSRSFQPLIILVSAVYRFLDSYSKEQILNSQYPLNYFINKSLKQILLWFLIRMGFWLFTRFMLIT